MTEPLRVVLDASVVIAAVCARNRRSASCILVEAAAVGLVRAIVSPPIVVEYRRKVADPEIAAAAQVPDPLRFALDLIEVAELVEPDLAEAVPGDPSDDAYLGTALAGRARYLVTFDARHLLPLDPFQGVRIVRPGAVLRALRGD